MIRLILTLFAICSFANADSPLQGGGAGCFSHQLPNYGSYKLSNGMASPLRMFVKFEEDGNVYLQYQLSFNNAKKEEVQCPKTFEKNENTCVVERNILKIEPGKKWIYRILVDKSIYQPSFLFIRGETTSTKHPIYIFYQYDKSNQKHLQGIGYERDSINEQCNKEFSPSKTKLPLSDIAGNFCLYELPLPNIDLKQ